MPIVYSSASPEVHDMISGVLSEYFSVVAGLNPPLRIDVKMGSDSKTLIGCKHNGHPCPAKIKVVKPEERATWNRSDEELPDFPDVRLFIDKYKWVEYSEPQRQVLLFHELNHLVPVRDKKSGQVKFDEYGRVKIKLRLDDWMLTGFVVACEIFGEDAIEFRSLANVRKRLSQLGLKFGKDAPKPKKSDVVQTPAILAESISEEVA